VADYAFNRESLIALFYPFLDLANTGLIVYVFLPLFKMPKSNSTTVRN